MSTSTPLRPAPVRPAPPGRPGPLRDLDRAADAFASLGPNWFASVMGTGIVATAAATLPVQWPGLREFATVVWVLAAGWLVVLATAEIVHWARHREAALGHARNPVMVQYYGAPPMALLTVGAGALLLGPAVIGAHAALVVDAVLWPLGTLGGLASSLAVPYLMFTRMRAAPDAAFGGWLMPVVPPMVSAATGALLIPHLPAGQARLSLLLACYAMFGVSLAASVVIITQLWQRLVRHSIGPAAMVPTLWIVLGPLGQSVTAAGLLGGAARLVLPYPYGPAFQAFGLVYGVPVWGFATLWAVLAAAITVRAARAHLPFSLTWWSFTFPVGTVVTATTSLALHTGDGLFRWAAAGLYLVLVAAWAVVSVRTVAGTWRGSLLRAPAPPVPADEVAELTLTGEGITGRPSLMGKSAAGGLRAFPRGGRVAAGTGVTPGAGQWGEQRAGPHAGRRSGHGVPGRARSGPRPGSHGRHRPVGYRPVG